MSQHGVRDQKSDAPTFVSDSANGASGTDAYGTSVYLADAAETATTTGVTVGWNKRTVVGSRERWECLVALKPSSVTTDSTSFADASTSDVANTTGTTDDAVLPDA